jgi:lipoprotein NlpD
MRISELPPFRHPARSAAPLALAAVSLLVSACALQPNRAPIEERSPTPRLTVAATTPANAASGPDASRSGALPQDNAGKPGYHTVRPGETLMRIALDNGQNWRDVVRWNNLQNPNLIEVGQVLRVFPPGADPTQPQTRPVTTARVESRPLDGRAASSPPPGSTPATGASVAGVPSSTAAPVVVPAPSAPAVAAAPPTVPPPPATGPRDPDDDIAWGWPVTASVAAPFDEQRNKGLVFRGKAGDPVLAAADGRVVYAGSGLRGYGNLVILKHNATYLTAYAHNQTLLVKDDQTVRRGQKIAEMGATDADGVQLRFEVRRQGRPVDPARLMPAR